MSGQIKSVDLSKYKGIEREFYDELLCECIIQKPVMTHDELVGKLREIKLLATLVASARGVLDEILQMRNNEQNQALNVSELED